MTTYPTRPKPPPKKSPHYDVPSGSGGGGGDRTNSDRSGGSGSGGSGGGGGGMSGAERRAIARENESKAKAAKKYERQAKNLEQQARALRHALRRDFKHALRIKLGNVNETLTAQQRIVREGYGERLGSLEEAASNNAKSEGQQSNINTANLLRERNSAVTAALAQGAGESDQLRSQMMSLRNWNANQSEVQTSFYDSLASINSSLHDLNVDTKTALVNNKLSALDKKEQLYTNYFNQRSEALTNLGNIRGQQADYYASAQEMSGGYDKALKRANRQARQAFMGAAKASGQAWDRPGVGRRLMRWDGRGDFHGEPEGVSHLASVQTVELSGKKPEGATLRKWEK